MLTALLCAGVISTVCGWTGYFFGPQLLQIFLKQDWEAIGYGVARITIKFLPYAFYPFTEVVSGALRGIGRSTLAMCISLVGICGLRIVWVNTMFRLPQFHNPYMLYLTFPVSWVVTFAALMGTFLWIYRKQYTPKEEENHVCLS